MKRWGIIALVGLLALAGCAATPKPIGLTDYIDMMRTIDFYSDASITSLTNTAETGCDVIKADPDNGLRNMVAATAGVIPAAEATSAATYIVAYQCPEYTRTMNKQAQG